MGCCGQRRARIVAALAARPQTAAPAPPPPVQPPAPEQAARAIAGVLIRYVERLPIQMMGPRTGRTYRFSAAAPMQLVATPDVPALLSMRQFRRA